VVTEIRVYVEGDDKLRSGFHEFFKDVREPAQALRIGFKCIPCGAEPVRDFCNALRSNPESFNVLLLDNDGRLSFESLKKRSDWKPPREVDEKEVHWMIQIMESWFLADIETLREYYGPGFDPDHLPGHPNVEEAPKADVERGLKEATRRTRKGPYHKTAHAPRILELLKPGQVRAHAPHCRRLFDTLLATLGD
jgi:hypothetical protein